MFKSQEEVKEYLVEMGYEDTIVFENSDYHTAFIGVDVASQRAVYDYDLMIQYLIDEEGFTEEDAIEWIDYNTLGAIPPGSSDLPIVFKKAEF